ncbi:hypothetical protein FHT44_005069 [Mycolicibacterium sp. BK634]|uniref:hypothetical protein n=1 Tax=Mycolicibacterium sp. BK634 TaxID=2587099 RepID=UPI00160ED2BB|nr:hypothetical protein [Mycolicibacterium sp. BK634]MBB3752557.1 hypothetical protein [Mycolicibacterium sp. BK634]
MIRIEDIETEVHAYCSSVEYLPEDVKRAAVLLSQDLSGVVADLLHVNGVEVNWSDGSYRGPRGIQPSGYSPQTYAGRS